ncbi:SCP-like protein [Ancylostoma caninum]|uniref:SCP-like protein n=1 Tax=Ancylostoma caninum TaxID=29170 RepID=A0A368FN39_ANCCA|nr:SCP-like protein [Ancylostoma caninum]
MTNISQETAVHLHEIDAFQHYDQFKEEDVLKKTFVGYLHYCKASAGCPDISWLINNHEKKCGIRIAEFPQLQNLKDEIAVKVGRRRVKRIDYRSYPQGGTFAHAKARKVTPPSNQSQLIIRTVKSRFVEERLRIQGERLVLLIMTSVAAQGIMAPADEEFDKVKLLTRGLEESAEEGSGLADEDEQRVDRDRDYCANSVMTLKHRNYILYTHNRLRSKLAQGRQPNKEGMMGSGKNIYLLKWDCDLERMARRWSQACPSFPVVHTEKPSGSQLVKQFDMNWQGINATQHIDDSMRSWWLEYKRNGNVDFKNRYSSAQNYYGWANMAKGKTTRIGCSYWTCDQQRAIFTCVYNAKAHCEKRKIYEPGPPCSSDDDCSTYPNSRSRLARGLEFNGEINATQPGARNMIKLEYDCHLEKYAQEWADKCTFEHSNSWERPNQGQNLYMTTIRNWETTSLLHTAMEIWWRELEEHGMPADAVLTESVWDQKGRLIGHFTQV